MIMIGFLIVILITGAWIAAGDGAVPGETDPVRGTAVLENRQDLLMELMETRRENASGGVNNISSPNRFLRADSGETAASRNHLPVLNLRSGVALVAGDPDDLREVEPSGFPVVGWVFLVGDYRAGSGENPFFVLASAACSSLDSGRAFDAHPEVAVERSTSFPLTGNDERVVAASSGMVPWARGGAAVRGCCGRRAGRKICRIPGRETGGEKMTRSDVWCGIPSKLSPDCSRFPAALFVCMVG